MESIDQRQMLRVAVMHHDPIVALGLRATLSTQADLAVRPASNPASVQDCDVVVCDEDAGLAIARPARAQRGLHAACRPRVLVFGHAAGEQHTRRALAQGVLGYVLPDTSLAELANAVRAVAAGQRYLSSAVALRLAESLCHPPLTPRESDVLEGLGAGQCNKRIARQLGISVATVKAHVRAVMGKTNAVSRTEAVSVALRRGLVGLAS